jgi:hypothetical protein
MVATVRRVHMASPDASVALPAVAIAIDVDDVYFS